MKLVNVNIDLIQVFLIINNVGIMINADVNAKNRLLCQSILCIQICIYNYYIYIIILHLSLFKYDKGM